METPGKFSELPENSPSALMYRYRFANVDFDESTNTVLVAGQKVAVERLPQTLLSELLRRPNEVVTRAELPPASE